LSCHTNSRGENLIVDFSVVIPADPHRVPEVVDDVTRILAANGWPEQRIMEIELALQEALTNAIRHGSQNDPTRQVQCVLQCRDTSCVMLTVRDSGQGFEAASVANPLAPENVLKPGGRGIFLINNLMDEVAYRDGGREVLMIKKRD
jgi:serine/threonine-protein kinase RsbW